MEEPEFKPMKSDFSLCSLTLTFQYLTPKSDDYCRQHICFRNPTLIYCDEEKNIFAAESDFGLNIKSLIRFKNQIQKEKKTPLPIEEISMKRRECKGQG